MSPSWGRIRVASSTNGLSLCSVVFIQIVQHEGSDAEWEGPAKIALATFVSHDGHHYMLFVMGAKGCFNH